MGNTIRPCEKFHRKAGSLYFPRRGRTSRLKSHFLGRYHQQERSIGGSVATTTTERPEVDRKARMKLPFEDVLARPVTDRVADYEPTFLPLTPQQARQAP